MISASEEVQAWTVALVHAAMDSLLIKNPQDRVGTEVTGRTPRPYAIVPYPRQTQDIELSDRDEYAVAVEAEIQLRGDENEKELVQISAACINLAEDRNPPAGWTLVTLHLLSEQRAETDDPNKPVYGRDVVFILRLSRDR